MDDNDELIGAYWDAHVLPLINDLPDWVKEGQRRNYIKVVKENPAAIREILIDLMY